jgi:hypothetical protein
MGGYAFCDRLQMHGANAGVIRGSLRGHDVNRPPIGRNRGMGGIVCPCYCLAGDYAGIVRARIVNGDRVRIVPEYAPPF